MTHITILGPNISMDMAKPADTCRVGCRAIIERDDRILFSYLEKRNQYLLPGGRMEICDTEISCVARECKEELGMEVKPYERVCIIDDCYNDRWFRNIYYSATIEKEHLPPAMVEDEIALGLRPVWLRKDGIVDFLLAQTILPVRLAEGHLLTVLNSHYREICALLTYFGSPLIPIPETLRSSAKRMVVESSETVPS